jgi:hypothetical protein
MSMSCGIFVQFLKCEILMSGKFVSFIPSCTLSSSRGRGGIKTIKRWVKNNRKDDNGFEHLRNWLTFFVTAALDLKLLLYYPSATRRHGNFAGVHTLLRILLSSNSAVLINIITGVSPPHFDFVVYYVLCQCFEFQLPMCSLSPKFLNF